MKSPLLNQNLFVKYFLKEPDLNFMKNVRNSLFFLQINDLESGKSKKQPNNISSNPQTLLLPKKTSNLTLKILILFYKIPIKFTKS